MNKELFSKKNLMPIVVLSAICIVVALLLGVTNLITAPEIERRNNEAIFASLRLVIPEGEFNTEPDPLRAGAPETVKSVYTEKTGKGTVIILETTKGYTGKAIGITVGIDNDGKIIDTVITKNEESIVPDALKPMGAYGSAYKDATSDTVADVVTGATVKYTESAIKGALKDAFAYLGEGGSDEEKLPKTDAELADLIGELAPGVSSENITPDEKSETLKRLYKLSDGSFMAYIVTSTQYVPVETEAMVHIGSDGSVLAVKKLSWVVGHGPESTPPAPDENEVNGLFGSFVGKDSAGIDGIDVVNGATGTSTHLRDAIKDAVDTAVPPLPRRDYELLALAKELMPEAESFENVTPADSKLLKRLYMDTAGNGYVAYINTFAQYGGTLESETLISIDNNGKIIAVKNLFWKVGHGPESTPPAPDEEAIAEFFGDFVGKKESDISSVIIAGATGTGNNVKTAILEALSAIPAKESQTPRIIGIVLLTLAAAAAAAYVVRRKLV